MNRYPLWKYIVIGISLLLGILYALPNLFGEVPAVQILPAQSALKVDTALLARVEEALAKANISAQGVFLDVNTVKVRFADTDTQLKAKDLLQAKLGDSYVVALNLLSSSPKWLSSIGALPMYLGLDLRGGVHFLLQVDMKAALDKAADRYVNDIRTNMRDKKIAYTGVSRDGQTVLVKFRDAEAREKGSAEISKNFPDLTLKETNEGGEPNLAASLRPEAQTKTRDYALQQNITTLRNRVNELGVAEPIIQQQGAERVVVQLPGVQDTAKAKDILGRTASLEVRMVDEEHSDPASLEAAAKGQLPVGDELYKERNGTPVLVKKTVVLTGERISDAQPGYDGQTGEPAVHLTLDSSGARIFQLITRENVGKRMAIL
ncbi:MAG: SecDF P1 head subdomain-containing protein, partial [Burkholderiales bacterium]